MHDTPFKPAKPPRSGFKCTIGGYPEYKANPEKVIIRKRKVDGDPEPLPAFKPTYHLRTRPSTSIATNIKNIKAAFPSVFK